MKQKLFPQQVLLKSQQHSTERKRETGAARAGTVTNPSAEGFALPSP